MKIPFLSIGIVVIGSVVIQLFTLAIFNWRRSWRNGRRVVATIKQIQIWLDGWYVIAEWTDILTGQSYTFRSRRIEFNLKKQVGDNVIVDVDCNDPQRYYMKL